MVTVAALITSQLFTWMFAPFVTTQQLTVLSPAVFDTRGLAYAACALLVSGTLWLVRRRAA